MRNVTRRNFLAGAGLATPMLLAGTSLGLDAASAAAACTFPQSVASGDPSETGVVLWTRIEPRLWRPAEPLRYEVAEDAAFVKRVAAGELPGADATSRDCTFKVLLDGQLKAGRSYFYRFRYRGVYSRTGRCRTLPGAGSAPERLKLAVVTCQDYRHGYYGAFGYIAAETDVDFVVHLGDLIYEGAEAGGRGNAIRAITLPSGQPRAMGLADFRHLYRSYRSDTFMRRAMENHTWIIIWDDHETTNDCYWDYARDTLGAPDHVYQTNPLLLRHPELARRLKLDAQRAWSEWLPVRPTFDLNATHPHQALRIYRSFAFGNLAELFMTDERTYRSPHPCGEGDFGDRLLVRGCDERFAPARSMLGATQRDWLISGLTGSAAQWKVWGNEVFVGALAINAQTPAPLVLSVDAWDGFADERLRILTACRDANVEDLVVLTGDLHTYMASLLKLDHLDVTNDDPANVVGVEFMTPAITSANLFEQVGQDVPPSAGDQFLLEEYVRQQNPHVQFFNSQDWGYSTVEFTPLHAEYVAFSVDKDLPPPFARRRILRRYRTPAGIARIDRV